MHSLDQRISANWLDVLGSREEMSRMMLFLSLQQGLDLFLLNCLWLTDSALTLCLLVKILPLFFFLVSTNANSITKAFTSIGTITVTLRMVMDIENNKWLIYLF